MIDFWSHHPALFYGISMLLGFYTAFSLHLIMLVPCLCLWLPFILSFMHAWKPFILSFTLFFVTMCYFFAHYTYPPLSEKGVIGKGHFAIESIRLQKSHFGSKWMFNGQLMDFFPNNHPKKSIARHIKCCVSIPANTFTLRPKANQDYLIAGTLLKSKSGQYYLRTSTQDSWQGVDHSWSLAENRYQWKTSVIQWIKGIFSSPYSAAFLGGLATGEFDDQWMRQEFSRFGLQHIMAISGFHFAIIVGVLSLILRLIFSRPVAAYFLLAAMAAYALFLGTNPSIMRAWIMSSVVIGGYLLEKNGSGLNSLGIALIGTLLFDPLLALTIGFQFSFLVTAAILLTYGTADYYLKLILPKRRLSEMIEMNGLNQHGYCVLAFFRQGLALMFAVNVFALPLTLYYFQQFPWMSLLYNLFFPLLIAGSLTLLIIGLLASWIPFFGTWLNVLNDKYTDYVLQVTYRMPETMDFYFRLESFPLTVLVGYLSLMTVGGILLRAKLNSEEEQPFTFV